MTVAQWKHRKILPAPDVDLSTVSAWKAETIVPWMDAWKLLKKARS